LLQSLTTGAMVAASGFNGVTEYISSFPVGLVSSDEYQLVILNSGREGMCCGYGVRRRVRRVLRNCGRPDETSWSLQSLTAGAVAAASGLNQVVEHSTYVAAFIG
jgi:hypothetical protein